LRSSTNNVNVVKWKEDWEEDEEQEVVAASKEEL
jgi:hypothetical protein